MKKRSPAAKADGRHAAGFLINLDEIQKEVQVTGNKGERLTLQQGFAAMVNLILAANARGNKVIFIGNGGSAAIASHQAVDFWKNGGIRATAFNDASLLTCLGNDCGYEQVFAKPISSFGEPEDVIVAISSSGRSPNILMGAKAALKRKCRLVTFTGFDANNPLRSMGQINFHVPVRAYGLVEVTHLALIHASLREIIYLNPAVDKRGY